LSARSGKWQVRKKKYGTNLNTIYCFLGCSKQQLFYWEHHPFSTQYRKSIWKVIHNASSLFGLTYNEKEILANKAGLSLTCHENGLLDIRCKYQGKLKNLYGNAQVSERMFRYYKTIEPTKQALQAIAVSLCLSYYEADLLLHKYGYCFSKSLANDVVAAWYLQIGRQESNGTSLLNEINETLYDMGLPLLMTRQHM